MKSAVNIISCKIFLDERTKNILHFVRSFFCGLNLRVALLLIGCTRHVVTQLLGAIFGGIF